MQRLLRTLGISAVVGGTLLGLLACGVSSSVAGGGTSTTTQPPAATATSAPPTATTIPPTATTAAPVACGEIDHGLGGTTPANYSGITLCFSNLFTHCAAGSMFYRTSGVDSGSEYTFTTARNGGACIVKVSQRDFVASGSTPKDTTTDYTCTSVTYSGGKDLIAGCAGAANIAASVSVP